MLKILHTGDLHLDSAFSSLDERQAKLRKNEMRAAFTSMMTYARMNGIDLLLMAGDVVDSRFVTKETAALLANELAKFEKPVFIAPGNHDYADQNSIWRRIQWPENVHIFLEDTLSCVDVPSLDIMVWGYGFTSPFMESCPAAGKTVADPNVEVTCLHGMNPSRVSEIDCDAYNKVADAVADTWTGTIVSPYLMVQCSDSRHYGRISDKVYRFSAMALTSEERATIHGNNERIRVDAVKKAVEFYIRLMRKC